MNEMRAFPASGPTLWGSDPVADLISDLGVDYVALTPGSSFRGLHDSLVNHRGGDGPAIVMAIHEESAVAIAHGYAKVAGKPMAAALHANVGLMHASMAIFNAWCDRVPVLLLGAVGPMDATRRRPWIDWIHTATDLGALIRPYIKWDNQPASLAAAFESLVRAHRIATTLPQGPVYVCLDQTLQEERLATPAACPDPAAFPVPEPAEPGAGTVADILAALRGARRPLILIGRVSAREEDWQTRVALAEALGVEVMTDLKVGARFPTRHPLHPLAPGLSTSAEALARIAEADVVLSLDWVDIGGTLLQANGGAWPAASRVFHCSLEQYSHNGWSMDYQLLPVLDRCLLADPDRLAAALFRAIPVAEREVAPALPAPREPGPPADGFGVEELAVAMTEALAPHRPCYARLPIGWPGGACAFEHPLDYLGYDGAGGIGSGPGMAVGAALALKGGDRLPVAVIGDGDFLMGLTALWSAVHHRIPLLMVVANNRSFFNDELHQERMARQRGRPVGNRSVGVAIDDPAPDLALLARGQGATGIGPVDTRADFLAALVEAVEIVRGGGVAVIDAHVLRAYGRGIPAGVLRDAASAQ